MPKLTPFKIDDAWILSLRGEKNPLNPDRPYAYLVEKERTPSGQVEDVATIFLTNRECPFRCLMCDLWKNTTDDTVASGAIPVQIEWALSRLPPAKHIKLYNSGNFFDSKAIPLSDYAAVASLLAGFETVIVECHPKLINERCLEFRDMLKPDLQIALGLETVHPEILQKLNKGMDLIDFEKSIHFLTKHRIASRAFILLRPPFLTEAEGVLWAKRSLDFAFGVGVECCAVIPTRAGNGAMDQLKREGYFSSPRMGSLECVLDYGIGLKAGRVFADLWDLKLFSSCEKCFQKRKSRLQEMNWQQKILPSVHCDCNQDNAIFCAS